MILLRTYRNTALACAGVLALAGTSPVRATTLADAVSLAYRTNPTLLSQREALRALDENYVQARAALGPQASFSADLGHEQATVDQPGSIFSPASTLHAHARTDTESLSVSQIIYNGGQNASAINAAEADILAGREQLHAAETQIIQQVINAYVGVRRDRELLDIAETAYAQLSREESETEARFKFREVTLTDLSQAKARLSASRASLAASRARLQTSQTLYLQVVGQNADDLSEPPSLQGIPGSVDAAFDLAEQNNPNLRASEFTERGSRARVGQERAAGNATLSARVDVTSQPEQAYDARYYQQSTTARLVLSKPLFTSGMIQSRVRGAIDRNNRDRLQIDAARRQAIQLVGQAWSEVQAADAAFAAQKEQVAAQGLAYDSVRAELKAGLRTTIEVLNAEQELQNAKIALAQAVSDSYLARVALMASIGILRADAIDPTLDPYNPEKAFRSVSNRGLAPWVGAVEVIDSMRAERPAPISIHDPAGEVRPDLGQRSPAAEPPSKSQP
jgi:TolC family type I secretion outer membrane protein